MQIYFSEKDHRYFCPEDPSIKFTSITKLIEMYHEKFDTETIAKKYAEKNGLNVEDVKKMWKEKNEKSVIKGSKFHALKEQELLNKKGVKSFGHSYEGEYKIAKDIYNLQPGLYPELIIWSATHGLIGTSDIVEIFDDGTFVIEDFKGFPLDTIIPTPNGFKEIQNLTVGDEIFDGEGKVTQVTNISQIHYNPCYKITFDTNESIVCDHEHKWLIEVGKTLQVLETEQIFNGFKGNKSFYRIKNHSIETSEKVLPIDPYVLGCWLGDGSSACGILTNANSDIWDEIKLRGYEIGNDVSQGVSGKATMCTIKGIHSKLAELNLLKNKHLPELYMTASYNQRLDLLRGFMDTDGYFNKSRNRSVMITTKLWQAEAICNLVFSLGGKATIINARTTGFGKTDIKTYHVCFRLPVSPFLRRNKDYAEHVKNVKIHKSAHRYIKAIEKVDTVPTICITVSSPLHTYMVTKNYLPTHNTNEKLTFEGYPTFNPKTKKREEKKMFFPINHLGDCNGIHYTIQLSAYAYMLELTGLKLRPNGLTLHHIIFDEEDNHVDTIYYPLNYLKKEVFTLFTHFKRTNK